MFLNMDPIIHIIPTNNLYLVINFLLLIFEIVNVVFQADWNSNDPYIILIPGFEGRPQIFESVAERLKLRAISVKLGPDMEGDCIHDIAVHARKVIIILANYNLMVSLSSIFNKINCYLLFTCKLFQQLKSRYGELKSEKFYVLGYSFGANVALELAAILEREGSYK